MNNNSIDYLESIEIKLDSLRTELMFIVAASRDSKELNEKIIQLSQKYKEPEILELIMYVNSSITIDLKQLKESLVKAVDTMITLKKEHIKQIKNIERRLTNIEQKLHTTSDKKPDTDAVKFMGIDVNSTKLKLLGILWGGLLFTITFIYVLVLINKEAATTTANIVKTTKEIAR